MSQNSKENSKPTLRLTQSPYELQPSNNNLDAFTSDKPSEALGKLGPAMPIPASQLIKFMSFGEQPPLAVRV